MSGALRLVDGLLSSVDSGTTSEEKSSLETPNSSSSSAGAGTSSATKDKEEDTLLFPRVDRFQKARKVLIYYSPEQAPKKQRVTLEDIADSGNVDIIQICTFHLSMFEDDSLIHLNDYPYSHEMFEEILRGVKYCQSKGIAVTAMIGGWEGKKRQSPRSESTWVNLFTDFDLFYPILRELILEWGFDGIDLDIEYPFLMDQRKDTLPAMETLLSSSERNALESKTLTRDRPLNNEQSVIYLMNQFVQDFGPKFQVLFAPVAKCVSDQRVAGLSGLSYFSLMSKVNQPRFKEGQLSSPLLNLQFYNRWGSLRQSSEMEVAITNMFTLSGVDPSSLLCGMIGVQSLQDGSVIATVQRLSQLYPSNFGGVFVWVGNDQRLLDWARIMRKAMDLGCEMSISQTWSEEAQ